MFILKNIAVPTLVLNMAISAYGLPNLEMIVFPTRNDVKIGDVIEMELKIKNVGDASTQIPFQYPQYIGVTFKCKDASVALKQERFSPPSRFSQITIVPGKSHSVLFALNRYLSINRPGVYEMDYSLGYYDPGSMTKGKLLTYKSAGTFNLNVDPGKPSSEQLNKYVSTFKRATDLETKQESIELIAWIEGDQTLNVLVDALRAAEHDLSVDDLSDSIVDGLERYTNYRIAQNALLRLAAEEDGRNLTRIITIFESKKIPIPPDAVKRILSSNSIPMTYGILGYMLRNPRKEYHNLVTNYLNDQNEALRGLAAQFVKKEGE
jgi:hypothetical protein